MGDWGKLLEDAREQFTGVLRFYEKGRQYGLPGAWLQPRDMSVGVLVEDALLTVSRVFGPPSAILLLRRLVCPAAVSDALLGPGVRKWAADLGRSQTDPAGGEEPPLRGVRFREMCVVSFGGLTAAGGMTVAEDVLLYCDLPVYITR